MKTFIPLSVLVFLFALGMQAGKFYPQEAHAISSDKSLKQVILDERDGQTYGYIQIGNLLWLTENLVYKAPESECYKSLEENCQTYGRLYSYTDSRTACPQGWTLPTPKQWKSLKKAMGSKKADKIIVPGAWESEEFQGANNELQLNVLPGGRKDEFGSPLRESPFGELGISTSYWLDDSEYHWHIRWGKSHIHKHGDISKQGRKFYIRCVKNGRR